LRIEAKEEAQKELVRKLVEDACGGRLRTHKNSLSKKVWVAEVGGETFIVKSHHPTGILEKLKRLIFGSRSRIEYRNIAAAQERGLPCTIPVGYLEYGRTHPSYLVLRKTPGLELGAVLPDVNGIKREEMLRRLGEYIRSIHSCGVFHGDLHPGNIFVDNERFLILDLQKTRFYKQIPERRIIRDIASLACGIERACKNKIHLAPFWEGYFGDEEGMRNIVESLMKRLKQKRIASRSARCLKESTEFCKFRFRGFKIFCRRSLSEQAMAWAQMILSSAIPPDRFVKVRTYSAPFGWFRAILRLGEMRAAWKSANRLLVLGVPIVKHLTYLRRVSLSGVKEYLITEKVEGNLQEKAHSLIMSNDEGRFIKFTNSLASLLNTIIRNGVYHKDLKAQNILVEGDLLMVGDLGAVSNRGLSEWRLANMIAQLNASLPACIPTGTRMRVFLKAIAGTKFWQKRRLIWNTSEALSEKRKAKWVETVRREGCIKGG